MAKAREDPCGTLKQIATSTICLATRPTLLREVGREVDGVLTWPMLEFVAELAADVGAVFEV